MKLQLLSLKNWFFWFALILQSGVIWAAPSPKGSLRVAYYGQDIPSADSLFSSFDPDSYAVITQIFDSLVHADLDGNLVPGLATSWTRMSPKVWEFQLRRGVRFHNGESFDSKAVKFTFDYILNSSNKAGNAWIFDTLESVEVFVDDPYRVKFVTKTPDGMFLNRFVMFGSICPPDYIQKVGMDRFHEHPVGTGPFEFVSWKRGHELVLRANPNYWNPEIPKLQELRFLVIPEKDWLKAIQTKKVDFVPNLAGNLAKTIARQPSGQIQIVKRLVLAGYWTMIRNQGVLKDVRVRRALNHAVDKQALVKFADFGNARPLASLGKVGEKGADESLVPYIYDPKKAKSLLDEAGIKPGLKLKALAADVAGNVAKILKANLAEVGIELNLEIVSRSEVVKRVVVPQITTGQASDYDLVIILVDNPTYNLAFHAGLFLASTSPWSLLNSEEFDRRLQNAITTNTDSEHVARLKDLDRFIHEQALMIFTTQRIITAAVRAPFEIQKFDLDGHVDYFLLSTARARP